MAKTLPDPAEADRLLWETGSIPVHQLRAFEFYVAMQHINQLLWVTLMLTRAETAEDIARIGHRAHQVIDVILGPRKDELQPPTKRDTDPVNYN